MSDQKIEIEISTTATGDGTQQATAELQKLNAETVSAAQSARDLADNPAGNWDLTQINAVADAFERIAAASQLAAENAAAMRANLEAVADQSALFARLGGDANPPLATPKIEENARVSSRTSYERNVPTPTPPNLTFGESPEVRAAIDRARAETIAVGKAWADGIAQLRAYIESQSNALAARQQNQIQ